jgi:hypothetical protein
MDSYDPELDGELLPAGDVCRLLHVSRSHLPNLRKRGVLRGYQPYEKASWRYPSNQQVLIEARAALRGQVAPDVDRGVGCWPPVEP